MRKNIIATKSPGRKESNRQSDRITIGMDLGDKTSRYCVLDDGGEVIAERSVASTKNGMLRSFAAMKRCRIALEVVDLPADRSTVCIFEGSRAPHYRDRIR